MKQKRFLALAIALLMVLFVFAACAEKPGVNGDKSTESEPSAKSEGSDESTASQPTAGEEEPLLLPDKYWGTTLTMLTNKNQYYEEYEFWWDESSEDVVVTAVVDRTRLIEETYGITLNMVFVDRLAAVVEEVEKAVNGGLEIDLVAGGGNTLGPSTLNGWYYDLKEENKSFNGGEGYIQFDASWWDQTAIRDLSMGNRIYFLTGDICVSDDESTWAMFFNKDLVDFYNLDDPYQLVKDDKWTLERLHQMAKEVALKHGEQMSFEPEDEDIWGMVAQAYDGLMFMLGCQQTMIRKNVDDIPELRIMETPNVDAFGKIFDILIDNSCIGVADFFGRWDSGVYDKEARIFANGNALFMPQAVSSLNSASLTESDVNFGIIPMPKFDEEQDGYSSSGTVYWLKLVAIPLSNAENLECTLFALEALAYYGQKIINPAYYEKVIKGQKVKDEESEKMLDLIFRNRTYDMSTVYDFGTGTTVMIQFYSSLLGRRPDNTMAAYYAQMESVYQTAIDKAVAAFQSNA